MTKPFLFAILFILLLDTPTIGQDDFARSDRLGITHISSATTDTPDNRYQNALALGAGWNRWPLYWNLVQPELDTWDWSAYDQQVRRDLEFGLNINAILLGRPDFFADGDRIVGIQRPIFVDGTDTPASGKALNPDNPWVHFVEGAVTRYMPGGLLSQQTDLPTLGGIAVWEIWNEPDFEIFWKASTRDYARLLKISYLVIKQIDPDAQVMFGGLLYPTENNWLAQVLNIYTQDPFVERNNWYMDLVAVHAYGDPWRSGWLTLYARQTMIEFGIDRPIWLNETGVPIWNDYPGPTWESTSPGRATTQQQAWYLIQSAAYAWSEGADKLFFHQLYDDCGDQPAGTDFPPHQGILCRDGRICSGDAHGIFRNTDQSICFSQHPQPGTARPVANAYRLLTEIFGTEPFDSGKRHFLDDRVVSFTFERPRTDERLTIMWNRSFSPVIFDYEAVGLNGQLISLAQASIITPTPNGRYQINLPPALPDHRPTDMPAAIGGPPYILIEKFDGEICEQSIELALEIKMPTAVPNQSSSSSLPNMPTIHPEDDIRPPTARVLPLPAVSPPVFTVQWEGADNSGIENYLIWVRVDGGDWQPWLETSQTSADYSGATGSVYEFAAWAVDLAGNWSDNADIQLQAGTRVQN